MKTFCSLWKNAHTLIRFFSFFQVLSLLFYFGTKGYYKFLLTLKRKKLNKSKFRPLIFIISMDLSITLSFLYLLLLNLIIFILFRRSQDGNSSDVQGGASTILLHPILKLQFRFLIPAVTMPVLLFRHIPIRLAFTVRSSISEGCEETSVLLAISVVASVTSSPFLFFVAYLCLIISSLRYGTVASLSQHIFNWFRNLTAIITPITGTILIVINRLNGNQEIAEQVDEENIIEAETNRIQNLRPSSTDDDENNLEVVVITWYHIHIRYCWCPRRVLVPAKVTKCRIMRVLYLSIAN